MFETLTKGFRSAKQRFQGLAELDEPTVDEALKDVRTALLEADVGYEVVQEFSKRVREQALGIIVKVRATAKEKVRRVTPEDHFVKLCHDELVELMGPVDTTLKFAKKGPTGVMMVGLQGSGKTTTVGKLAMHMMNRHHKRPLLVAADVYRPAAIDQLETLGRDLSIPVYADRTTTDVVKIARAGVAEALRERDRVVIIDTAGRLQIDDAMMQELLRLKEALRPAEILLVADGMTGQDAVKIAQGFDSALDVTGVILTKMDGDARGGAALSIYGVTKKPIKYIGVGEKSDALEEFHPERMAGRILQMGDIVTLVEKAQASFDEAESRRLEKKVRKEGMDLNDFLNSMRQIQKMGPLEGILKMLPGVNTKALKQMKADPNRMKHVEAIVLSMTPEERKNPGIINGSRRSRISKGSGRPISDVNRLLDQFREMQKMMKKMAGGGRMGMPSMPGMFGMR